MIEWFDQTILDWFLGIQNPLLTAIMRFFTVIGEGGAVWILLAVLFLCYRKTRKIGVVLSVALILCLFTGNILLKNIVARPRPCWRVDVPMLIAIPRDYSFPSGHTMSSVAAAVSLFLWDRKWGIVALVVAILISVSRMYFYVHYPTDVLAGAAIGVLLAFLAHGIVDYWQRKCKPAFLEERQEER